MTTAIKRRRGTTAQHATFTGLEGELTVDTTKDTVVVHDGATAGGFPLLKEAAIGVTVQAYDADLTNWAGKTAPTGAAVGTTDTQTLTNKTISGASNTLSNIGNSSLTNSAVTIGSTSVSLGATASTVAGLTLTGAAVNGTVGASTPSTGAFTTLSASSTVTLSGGTANGVAYLNGSKVLTTGSALTFDGSALATTGQFTAGGFIYTQDGTSTLRLANAGGVGYIGTTTSHPVAFTFGGSEQMRLTSTGLGIGTSSPSCKFQVANGSGANFYVGLSNNIYHQAYNHIWQSLSGAATEMTLDQSGNLGLGVTPSAWGLAGQKVLQVLNASLSAYTTDEATLSGNAYHYGAGWKYIASNYAEQYAMSSGKHIWYTAPSGTAGNAISFTQAMTLDASGNLGIGTTTPDIFSRSYPRVVGISASTGNASLSVNGASGSAAFVDLGAGGTRVSYIYSDAANYMAMATIGALPISFQTNATERMRIDSSGSLLIGATSSNGNAGGAYFQVTQANNNWVSYVNNSQATGAIYGHYIQFTNQSPNDATSLFLYCGDSTTRAAIRSNGGLANYQANNVNISDRQEKTNFAPAKNYLDTICAIPVQTFNYVDQNMENDPGLTLGVVAQDVQAVAPELVVETNWANKDEPEKMRLSIYQTDLQYALMKCIQELKAEVDQLKGK